jgi:hypothetical protein
MKMFHVSIGVLLLLFLLLVLLFFFFFGAAPPNGRPSLNQEPFGPQEGEREGPDGPLSERFVSLGSFVAIFALVFDRRFSLCASPRVRLRFFFCSAFSG